MIWAVSCYEMFWEFYIQYSFQQRVCVCVHMSACVSMCLRTVVTPFPHTLFGVTWQLSCGLLCGGTMPWPSIQQLIKDNVVQETDIQGPDPLTSVQQDHTKCWQQNDAEQCNIKRMCRSICSLQLQYHTASDMIVLAEKIFLYSLSLFSGTRRGKGVGTWRLQSNLIPLSPPLAEISSSVLTIGPIG